MFSEDVEGYDIQERDCLFQTEQSKIFHGYYSFSDCIVHCRMQDVFRLCVPFFYPTKRAFWRICNLKDLSCLLKYKERWQNVNPRFKDDMTPFKFEELSGYLTCDCFPSCTDVTYNVQSSSIPSLSELSWGRKKYSIKNHSILHIYFGKMEAIRLRQDVVYYWYDLMSNYGGVCSLFLGVSIINVIEILYNLIIRIFYSAVTNQPTATQITEKVKKDEGIVRVTTIAVEPVRIPEVDQPLHWEEITGAFRKEQLDSPNLLLNPLLKQ
ncbi:LOW QUALITY PROTEIN: sodium channel protein Nach-like [Temnothorax nylanderi]|uniref:LOW QUALITY PROTEIN: sodium channel protein Nach-like n=1 Tax=Temnothorax nylanderi TaxID=102681 RepID=UPI003A83D7EE